MTTPLSTYDETGMSMNRNAEILARMVELVVEWKGTSVSTDEKEAIGHLLGQMAHESDSANEKIQAIYDAISVNNNSGVPLANILELIGLFRQSAAFSTATVTFTASKAATIPAGTTVKTEANVYWETDEELVFSGSGTDDVDITCTKYGANNAAAAEINTIVNSVDGITAVTNAAAAIPGRLIESDAEFKLRHDTAVATSGERDAASISEAVGAVAGVSAVLTVEDYDLDAVNVYVIGGADADIATAMDPQITIGVGPILEGTTSVDVYSSTLKQNRTMKFTRGANVDVYIDILIETTDLYPSDGDLQIKEAFDALGTFDGNNLGDDVLYLKMPAGVYAVPGAIISTLYIGLSPSPTGVVDLVMANTQRASLDVVRDADGFIISSNITISHV